MTARIGVALDMDFLIFEAMTVSEHEQDWGDDIWSLECDHAKARGILGGTIKSILASIEADIRKKNKKPFELVPLCIISGNDNFRKEVLPTYKANRKGKRKPVGYPAFVEACMQHYGDNAFRWDGVEGDDVCGILMTNPALAGCVAVVSASCDKDFNTVPGMFMWLTKGKMMRNSEAQADRYHMYQTLIGDVTDGYSGIPGVGPVVAEEFLDSPLYFYEAKKVMKSGPRKGEEVAYWASRAPTETETLWDCMVSLAASKGMTEAELLQQAQVARILRWSDWDHENKKPILWKP
ncbi:hypothetical protein [Pseudomonas fontis]|uniref:Exonuclease n=1 Tax=Pseudomonas fontis TaxID=2942633 RepID=A0ABT5NL14_9PSED|nr:hypothetical protein [Pseudomonas fontis]MDD0975417.1 hypothetical protein [Pseudomonas fontis]MDD0989220.1 hypothetical protein [Pseudomonas fontis]